MAAYQEVKSEALRCIFCSNRNEAHRCVKNTAVFWNSNTVFFVLEMLNWITSYWSQRTEDRYSAHLKKKGFPSSSQELIIIKVSLNKEIKIKLTILCIYLLGWRITVWLNINKAISIQHGSKVECLSCNLKCLYLKWFGIFEVRSNSFTLRDKKAPILAQPPASRRLSGIFPLILWSHCVYVHTLLNLQLMEVKVKSNCELGFPSSVTETYTD